MSYTIVYDRVVIKTPRGYTFAVLHGDNNVWTGYGRNERRARDWNCWLLDVPETEVHKYFSEWMGQTYQEHFKYHGKWVDDATLERWYRTGIKTAKTLEEILELTGLFFRCSLSVWNNAVEYNSPGHHTEEMRTDISNTSDFMEWIDKAKARMDSKTSTETVYILTSFGTDNPLRLGRASSSYSGPVLAKYKRSYVYEVRDGHWNSAGPDINKAIVFSSIDDAISQITNRSHIKFVNAARATKPRNYVISADNKSGIYRGYVLRRSRAGIYFTDKKSAKHFTLAEANQFVSKTAGFFLNYTIEKVTE